MTKSQIENESLMIVSKKLESFYEAIHSIVLIGSRAMGTEEEGSDLDVVVVCKAESRKEISRYLWDLEIDESMAKVQFIPFDPDRMAKIFKMGSPLAIAIINGKIIRDDGYLENLIKTRNPSTPGLEYYLYALDELIAFRYYDTLFQFEREIRSSHSGDGYCAEKGECEGHSPADMLASVVMRLLYVTLPARGYTPLSKSDVIRISGEIYGASCSKIVQRVSFIHRNSVIMIRCDEYRRIKPFAVMLFKEALALIGKEDSRRILKKAATVMRVLQRS